MTDYDYYFGEPKATHDEDLHIYTWEDDGKVIVRMVFDRVGDRSGKLESEVSVYTTDERPIVGPVNVNLLTTQGGGLKNLETRLNERAPGPDWGGALQRTVGETVHTFREGHAGVELGSVSDQTFEAPFLIDPYIASSGVTVMYGEGGLAKSTLALAFALSVASGVPIFGNTPTQAGPVVYFDYEDDEEIHDARLLAMCRHLGIDSTTLNILHVSLIAKVTNAIPSMKRKVRDYGANFAVLDSIGMGRGGDAASAEDTIRLFRALRSLRLPILAIDHISKEAKGKKGMNVDAFGSVYTMNSTRLAWALKRGEGPDSKVIYLTARNTKANHTRRVPDRGIEIRIKDEDYVPKYISITTTDALRIVSYEPVSVRDRMTYLLVGEQEGLPIQDIADQLDVKRGRVDNALARDGEDDDPVFERRGRAPVRVRMRDWDTLTSGSKPKESEE